MYVYILFSEIRSEYYVGQTTDIEKRLKRHNAGVVPSTKRGVPWSLVLQIQIGRASCREIVEKKMKERGAERYLKDLGRGVYNAVGVTGLKPGYRAVPKCREDAEVVTLKAWPPREKK